MQIVPQPLSGATTGSSPKLQSCRAWVGKLTENCTSHMTGRSGREKRPGSCAALSKNVDFLYTFFPLPLPTFFFCRVTAANFDPGGSRRQHLDNCLKGIETAATQKKIRLHFGLQVQWHLGPCTGGLVYSHDLQTCDWPRKLPAACRYIC